MGWIRPLFKHVLNCIDFRNEPMVLDQEKHFRKVLERGLQKRLGFLLKKPNIALATSALHPAFAILSFIPRQLLDDLWENWRSARKCPRDNPTDLSFILQGSYFALLQPPRQLSEFYQVEYLSATFLTTLSSIVVFRGSLVVSEHRSLYRCTKG